tara:strand:- start:96 stop:575 length:480 start_codon:yes stop_codon:yes gene_type:complete
MLSYFEAIGHLGRSKQKVCPELFLPLAQECISAGFPSPADEYTDARINLNETLIKNPSSTFFLRVSGTSMLGAGIMDGDLLLVDRSLEPYPNRIVVAILDGAFTVKRLTFYKGEIYLEAENPNHPKLNLNNYETIQIWGVAIYSIHRLDPIIQSPWTKL